MSAPIKFVLGGVGHVSPPSDPIPDAPALPEAPVADEAPPSAEEGGANG